MPTSEWQTPQGAERLVTRTLPLFGRGPVLCLGTGHALVRACRAQGVPATGASWPPDGEVEPAPVVFVAADMIDSVTATRLRAIAGRDLFVLGDADPSSCATRDQALLEAGFCRHPRSLRLTPYEALGCDDAAPVAAFRALPEPAAALYPLEGLAAERGLHMDMLREHGRRADAHIARYALACEFVRPRDRVLDLACGMGYGVAILREGTRAATILGIDRSVSAIHYAEQLHGNTAGVDFQAADAAALHDRPGSCFDVVVSFETLEHLDDPRDFVTQAARLLTPAGRLICSIPDRWLDEHGCDPNPHHLHVFDRERLVALCAGVLRVETLYAQTAGGGMKLGNAPRSLREVHPRDVDVDAEWWLLVAMKDPAAPVPGVPYRDTFAVEGEPRPTSISFTRDYQNAWLVRGLISRGLRATSPALLEELAEDTAGRSAPISADRGAALCVRGYLGLEAGIDDTTLDVALDTFCSVPDSANPHIERWRISNEFLLALRHLQAGRLDDARTYFERCARRDCLRFGPLIATKTVEAAFWAGWLGVQTGDLAAARTWWMRGLHEARRAVSAPWDEVIGSVERPLLFGMRELTDVLDVASTCSNGLHMLEGFADRPGLAAEETVRHRRHDLGFLAAELRATRQALDVQKQEVHAWRAQDARRRLLLAALTGAGGVVIFGAGEGGRRAVRLVERFGGRVVCLIDNRPDLSGTTRHGHRIDAPTVLGAHTTALVVIGSSIDPEAIAAQVAALGVPADRITTRTELTERLGVPDGE